MRSLCMLIVAAALLTSYHQDVATAADGCRSIDAQYDGAERMWKSSRFHEASIAYERLASVIERCDRRAAGLTQQERFSIGFDLLCAGETAHQAGETKRSVSFVRRAVAALTALTHGTYESTMVRGEIGDAIDRGRNDLHGVWTEQGRLE